MAGSGWEALPESREWSEVVRKPSWTSSSGRVSLLEDGSGQETLTEVLETFLKGRQWSGGHPIGPEVVGRPTQVPGVVGRYSQMSGSGWEAHPEGRDVRKVLPEGWEWSGGPLEGPEVVGKPLL